MIDKAPKRISTIICEDIRHEQGNKVSLSGVYSGAILFQTGTAADELTVPQLAIFAQFEHPKVDFKSKFQIVSPSKEVLFDAPEREILFKENGVELMTFAVKFLGFQFPTEGEYSIVYWFDQKKISHKFNVQIADV